MQIDKGGIMFEKELNYFIKNQNELVAKHSGKVLVIKDDEVVGTYNSPLEAFVDAKSKFEAGTFMIQPCSAGVEAYTVSIATYGIFST